MRAPSLPPAPRSRYVADDTRVCYACGSETAEPAKRCPACGSVRIRSGRAVRRLGWVLVVLGVLLMGGMAYLSVVVVGVIALEDYPGSTTRFTGGPEDLALIAGVFGFVFAVGATAAFGGVWQIRYGRPNRVVMVIAFVAVLAILFLGRAVRTAERFGG